MVQRAFIGVVIQDVDQQTMNDKNLPNTKGVFVIELSESGAAKEAGIKPEDVILKVENVEVNNVPELQEQIGRYRPGDKVNVIIRRGTQNKLIEVVLRNQSGNTKLVNKKALDKKLWSLEVINIRDYSFDKHKTVDDTPFGGGSGMLMRADVIARSLDKNIPNKNEQIIFLSPKGKKFDQSYARKMLNKNVNIICGHFEGVDQRLLETRNIEEVSIGDFVLSGGEIGAFVLIDTIVRLIPGVLGNPDSLSEETFERDLLEYPQYTKPQKWEEKEVPNVLLGGDHAKIKDWRLTQSEDITRRRRPDLWKKYKNNK